MNPQLLATLMADLKSGRVVGDRIFDKVYPAAIRAISSKWWTPVAVARFAARWLSQGGARRILDVGAGVGKFCIVGATSVEAQFVGVEQRAHLVDVARDAVRTCGVQGVRMVYGNLSRVPWSEFDGFYFYNPFEEHRCLPTQRIDQSVERSENLARADITCCLDALARAVPGTRVVTFHGLGAELPDSYRLIDEEHIASGRLRCWVQGSS